MRLGIPVLCAIADRARCCITCHNGCAVHSTSGQRRSSLWGTQLPGVHAQHADCALHMHKCKPAILLEAWKWARKRLSAGEMLGACAEPREHSLPNEACWPHPQSTQALLQPSCCQAASFPAAPFPLHTIMSPRVDECKRGSREPGSTLVRRSLRQVYSPGTLLDADMAVREVYGWPRGGRVAGWLGWL